MKVDKNLLKKIIERYMNLNIGGKNVRCPYFINTYRKKDLRVMVGKGDPDEIETEIKLWAKIKNFNLNCKDISQIREFMINIGIGIDCSGFVVHVLNMYFKSLGSKSIWRYFKLPREYGLFLKIGYLLRPAEKLGAEIITNQDNCHKINKIRDIKVLDLIRSKSKVQNGHHVMIVTDLKFKDIDNKLEYIEYAHSTPHFGDKNGVKYGRIKIKNEDLGLEDQIWEETDEEGNSPTLEGYLKNVEDNGIRRPKFYDQF